MARRIGIAASAALLLAIVLPALPAAAGGGCHGGATDGTGDTVEMIDACFTPTVLRIDPGGSVTFVNTDPFAHNVGGNLWGHFEDLNRGDRFTATFDEAGIYPFACNYHPGMTGAIVVGDGTDVGSGETVEVGSLVQPEPVVEVRTVTAPASSTPVVLGWTFGAAIGLGIGLGIAALVRRSRQAGA